MTARILSHEEHTVHMCECYLCTTWLPQSLPDPDVLGSGRAALPSPDMPRCGPQSHACVQVQVVGSNTFPGTLDA